MTEKEPFLEVIKNRILLFDGAMGTEIQKFNPKPEDFPNNQDGFNDGLIITHPEWIKEIHRNYLDAGADCIETNSFGSNKIKLDEYGFGAQTIDFNKKIAQLASQVCSEYTDPTRYVIGSMGPSGFLPSSNDPDLGLKPIDEIREAFELQAEGLILGGTNIQAAYTTVSDMGIDVFGLNCSTGPIEMTPSVRWLDEQNEHNLLVVPNAGMPENQGGQAVYKMTPEKMGEALGDFITQYKKVRIIGGCCCTNPEHIAVLRKVIDEKAHSTKG